MPAVIVFVGISGCGKSTLAEKLRKKYGLLSVSSDRTRGVLYGDEGVQANPGLVFEIAHQQVICLLKQGKSVCFDATNVTSWSRKALLDKLPEGIKKIAVVFRVDPQTAIRQMANRERQVPHAVIRQQWEDLLADYYNLFEEFDEIHELLP